MSGKIGIIIDGTGGSRTYFKLPSPHPTYTKSKLGIRQYKILEWRGHHNGIVPL